MSASVSVPLPARPFARTLGALDAFNALADVGHRPDEAAPGSDVNVGGWIVDGSKRPVAAAWVDVAGVSRPVMLNRMRPDVARAHVVDESGRKHVGFEALITLPDDMPVGFHECRVIGLDADGTGLYAATARRVRIVSPRIAAPPMAEAHHMPAATLRVSDTETAPHTLGRGAHTIREGSSMRLTGQVAGTAQVVVSAETPAGARCAWTFPCDSDGRFDAALWMAGLDRGLYALTVAAAERSERPVPCLWCEVDIAGAHHLAPLHLGRLRTPPDGGVTHFANAAPRSNAATSSLFVAGQPIGVAGWCLDPAAAAPVIAVYVQTDDLRPVPISHRLPDPRPHAPSDTSCGFGGIIDTTRLEPGEHRIRLLGAAVSGAGWYVIDDRSITLADHRLVTSTTSGALEPG